MEPTRTCLRTLAFGSIAFAGSGCVSGSPPHGDDSDPHSGDSTSVRWSTFHPDVEGLDVALAPDGSIYVVGVAGYTRQGDSGTYDDWWLGRFDPDGELLREVRRPMAEDGYASPSALAVDEAGDVYLAMLDLTSYRGNNRLRKLDPNGTELWTASMPGRVYDVAALPDGGAIVVGSQDTRAWAQIVADDGTLGWARTFGEPGTQAAMLSAVALTPDGSGALIGGRLGPDPGNTREYAWVATLDLSDATERWQLALSNGTASDRIHGLGVATDGTAIVASTSANRASVDAFDTTGAGLWSWEDYVTGLSSSLAVFPDGGFAVGDHLTLDHPSCSTRWGSCPTAMRIERLEPGRTSRWGLATFECGETRSVLPTADGGLLVLASCSDTHTERELGLFHLEP